MAAPWFRCKWFVLGHDTGVARPNMLGHFITMGLTPKILASAWKTPTHQVAPPSERGASRSTQAQAGGREERTLWFEFAFFASVSPLPSFFS